MKEAVDTASEWANSIASQLNGKSSTGDYSNSAETGIWEALKSKLKIAAARPERNPDVIASELKDRKGTYYVLKNTKEKTYLRLSADEYQLWLRMDGQTTVVELIVDHYMRTQIFAHNLVIRLVDQLYTTSMLIEAPIFVWSQLKEAVNKRTWLYRLSAPAQAILTRRLGINKIDEVITLIYRYGGWLLFTPVMNILFIITSLLGIAAFYEILNDPNFQFLGDNVLPGLALLWVVSILPVVIHELGHGLTVKHYGREVPQGGVMLYFGMPAAYVETTDIWLEPRRARLAVTWNGPYTGLILGGLASILIYAFPGAAIDSLLFKMAGFAYLTVFFNVNPLLKLDGYYLLSDALDIPLLRERSIAFVRRKAISKVLQREKFTREEWIFTIFGLLSIIWSMYALYLISFFWRTRLRTGVEQLFGTGYPLLARFFSLLLIGALVSFAFLIILSLFRLAKALVERYVRSGLLERHGLLALVSLGLILALGFGLPLILQAQASWIAGLLWIIAGTYTGLRFVSFSRAYAGSPRGFAHIFLICALAFIIVAGVLRITPEISQLELLLTTLDLAVLDGILQVSIVLSLILAGILFIWPPRVRLGLKWLAFGLLLGIAAPLYLLVFSSSPATLPNSILIGLLALSTVWMLAGSRGSARFPAFALLSASGFVIILSWFGVATVLDLSLIAYMLLVAGALHLIHARLPRLSAYTVEELSSDTNEAMRESMKILVRRVISQVYFESGLPGVLLLGENFSRMMRSLSLEISLDENQFNDPRLEKRTVDEITEVYRIVFEELHRLISHELGRSMGNLAFGYGMDLLPWQIREIVVELVLSRTGWGLDINQEIQDKKAKMRKLLKRVPLFANLGEEELNRIAENLRTERVPTGEAIIRQGDPGDKFYIIDKGNVTVWQKSQDDTDEKQVQRLGPGQFFGEIALVTSAPRNATVKAATPVDLLTLGRSDFDNLIRQHITLAEQVNSDIRYNWLLRGMPLFDELESYEIELLAALLQTEIYNKDEVVFREGDSGDRFYIIESGEVIITRERDGKPVEISRRRAGEYLGEIALLQNTPRTATVVAAEDVTLLSLEREFFLNLVSNFMNLRQTLSRTSTRRLTFTQSST